MQVELEMLDGLERKIHFSVALALLEARAQDQLKKRALSTSVPGFRPGKAPLKLIGQRYGQGIYAEVLKETVQQVFEVVIREQKIRVAGYPRFERGQNTADSIQFIASFEALPEIEIGDLSDKTLIKLVCELPDDAVEKTLEALQRQHAHYIEKTRAAQTGDKVVADFQGTIEGVPFNGGSGVDFPFVIGSKALLPEFESAAIGLQPGETKTFDLTFPDNHIGQKLASKKAQFSLTVKSVAEAVLPPVDSELAIAFGIEDGDIEQFKKEVRSNIDRELQRRLQQKQKEAVLQLLLESIPVQLPIALVRAERQKLEASNKQLVEKAHPDQLLASDEITLNKNAERAVAIRLILSHLVEHERLRATYSQVKSLVEDFSESYENPEEIVRWHYSDPARLEGAQSRAFENNIVNWVLERARIEEKPISFSELMGEQYA